MNQEQIDEAVEALRSGGTVIYPTETCYGIGCDALDEKAIKEIYEIKQRPQDKPLTVIVDSLGMAERYCTLSSLEQRLCERFMPGPLTLLAAKNDNVPGVLNDRFAFRVPASELCRNLASGLKRPVVATSANLSGQPASYSVDEIDPAVIEHIDVILDGGRLEERPSSTIVEVTDGELHIVREGPIDGDELREAIDDD